MPQLETPTTRVRDSYIKALAEYQHEGLMGYMDLDAQKIAADFPTYVEELRSHEQGKNLPEGYVSETVLWLTEGDLYIGRLSIRHELNEGLREWGGHIGYDIRPSERHKGYGKLILELGLKHAREMNINKILITCDINNDPSRKIIEANGGKFEDIRDTKEGKKRRYWISL